MSVDPPKLCCKKGKTPQVIDRVSYTFAIWKVRRGNEANTLLFRRLMQGGDDQHE